MCVGYIFYVILYKALEHRVLELIHLRYQEQQYFVNGSGGGGGSNDSEYDDDD